MRIERMSLVGAIAGVVLSGLVAAAPGCGGSDDNYAVGGEEQGELRGGFRSHRRHRANDAGIVGSGAGGTAGGATGDGAAGANGTTAPDGDAVANCAMCAKAQQCCAVVENRVCTFISETCNSTVDDGQPHIGCLTYVVSVRGAWGGNPPAECR